MSGPRNARTTASGVRVYTWAPADGSPSTEVLSVTSIRKLNGLPMGLVNWQLNNIVNVATGTRQVVRVGPRGGVKKAYVADGDAPGEFGRRLVAAEGAEGALKLLRKYLREQADAPRDVAAVKGTIVHGLIERGVPFTRLTDDYVTYLFESQWERERSKVKSELTEDDMRFVQHSLRQYEDFRAHERFVILAQEPQIWNLTHGYSGSADVLVAILPEGAELPDEPTADDVLKAGGRVAVWDWKTAEDVVTDYVVQVTAYLSGEFIGADGVVDQRLTDLLAIADTGGIVTIRPDKWGLSEFSPFVDGRIVRAFLGSLAFARFVAEYPEPSKLFTRTITGKAAE